MQKNFDGAFLLPHMAGAATMNTVPLASMQESGHAPRYA